MLAVLVDRTGFVSVKEIYKKEEEISDRGAVFVLEDSGQRWGGEEAHWYREKGNEK